MVAAPQIFINNFDIRGMFSAVGMISRRFLVFVLCVPAFILLFCLFILASLYVYQSNFHPVIRICKTIGIGDDREAIEALLNSIGGRGGSILNRGAAGTYPIGSGIEYESSIGVYEQFIVDDLQCNVFFSDGRVVYVEIISD